MRPKNAEDACRVHIAKILHRSLVTQLVDQHMFKESLRCSLLCDIILSKQKISNTFSKVNVMLFLIICCFLIVKLKPYREYHFSVVDIFTAWTI